jgi:ABC-2 type transport system permease protein
MEEPAVAVDRLAFDALDRVASGTDLGGRGWLDVAVIVGVTLLALAPGAATLRRRTPLSGVQ